MTQSFESSFSKSSLDDSDNAVESAKPSARSNGSIDARTANLANPEIKPKPFESTKKGKRSKVPLLASLVGLIVVAGCVVAVFVWGWRPDEDGSQRQMMSIPFDYLEFSHQALQLPCEWYLNSTDGNAGNTYRVIFSTIDSAFPFQKSIRITLKGSFEQHLTNTVVVQPIVAKAELQISADDHGLVSRAISLIDCNTQGGDKDIDLFLKDSSAALDSQLDDCLTFHKHPIPVAGFSIFDMEHFSIILQETEPRNNQ